MTRTAVAGEGARAFEAAALERTLAALDAGACVYFPVRHHSPACAWHLERLIREMRPTVILVEGPASFTPLIDSILDPATRAPVAIYTHFVDVKREIYRPGEGELDFGPARFAAYYPFCDYSPELVALRAGRELGARLRFIDLDYADQVCAEHLAGGQMSKPRIETLMQETRLQQSSYLRALAVRSGCRDFNEMWDHLFEADFQSRRTEVFLREVATYCYFARHDASDESLEADGTNARERAMAAAICEEQARIRGSGGRALVVTGGFHSVALPQLVAQGQRVSGLTRRSSDEVQQALIRYSFEQLDSLNGYAAGMPSPRYYNCLWAEFKAGNAAAHASVAADLLVEIGRTTRERDMQVALSTADEIAALGQANLLASLRGHPGPAREDLMDGVRSCFVKGSMDAEGTVLMSVAARALTGTEIGEVPLSAGQPPIVESFRREASRARLDIRDSIRKRVVLDIYRREAHRQTSRLLHALSFLGVPFAGLTAGPDFVGGTGLERIHEHWQYAWSPMTEGALVGAAVYGSTVEEATANRLREAIARLEEEGSGRSAGAAVAMLVRACRMGLHRHTAQLLSLIASKVSEEPSFIEALAAANQLLLLWQSREPLEAHTLPEVPQLLKAAYQRACSLAHTLAQCAESDLAATLDSLAGVREILAAGPAELLDEELFWEAARRVLSTPNQAHPPYSTICGAVAGLLSGSGRMAPQELDELVTGYLVGISDAPRRVGFLRGLLKTCREAAWQNDRLIHSLDQILGAWEEAEFIAALPSLRLALADLTPRETDKMAGRVATLHGRRDLGDLVHTHITEAQLEINRRITVLVMETLAADGLGGWLEGDRDE